MSEPDPTSPQHIFFTGSSGVLGRAAIPRLIGAGHRVTALAHGSESAAIASALGADPVQVDIFDQDAIRDAMDGATVVAHFATSIPIGMDVTRRSAWAMNDRLRLEGTRNLIRAAEAVGVGRFIFESIALAYADGDDRWIDESSPFVPVAHMMESAVAAEEMVRNFQGDSVNLRFGRLYGPGNASEALIESTRDRKMPIVGSGHNYFSNIHSADAGRATAAAINVLPGDYNIVDDEPLTQRQLAESLADLLSAKRPRRLPYPLARIILHQAARVLTVSQRVSNQRFRDASGWAPTFPSAIDGLAQILRESRSPQALPA